MKNSFFFCEKLFKSVEKSFGCLVIPLIDEFWSFYALLHMVMAKDMKIGWRSDMKSERVSIHFQRRQENEWNFDYEAMQSEQNFLSVLHK